MNKEELIQKIIQKKEFSDLPKKDIEVAFDKFSSSNYLDEEKIKLTRDFLRKVFSAFVSHKILSLKDKTPEWILRKHLSTRERLPHYFEIYTKIFEKFDKKKKVSVIDLGAGINGFSYQYFLDLGLKVNYTGIEAMGQLVDLTNSYFLKNKYSAQSKHLSLFDLDSILNLVNQQKKPKIIFLFKVLDSLEMLKKDYSKLFLREVVPLVDRVVISFATKSMLKRTRFKVNRNWIVNFIKDNFNLLEDFEVGGERYIVFRK